MTASHPFGRRSFSAVILVICGLGAAIQTGCHSPASSAEADPAKPAAKTFRLADGSETPIEQYGETYETLEWRPPLDPKKAKIVTTDSYDSGFGAASIALDLKNKKVYWFLGGGRHGTLMRANFDGSGRKMLLNGLMTPDGEKEIEGARELNAVPELKKIFWRCRSCPPDPPGNSIYEADLDGKNPKSIVTGLNCTALVVDPVGKKMYYNDEDMILRSNLDGTGTEELGAKARALFAIDYKRKVIYSEGEFGIFRQAFDGSDRKKIYECLGLGSLGLSIAFDASSDHLYWLAHKTIARAPVDDLYAFEELVDTGPYEPPFAVDTQSKRLFWVNTNGNMLSAPLPPVRTPVTKAAPPLITGFDRTEAAYGDEVTIRGSGLSQCRRLFWIGSPTAKFVEGKLLSLGNDVVTAKVPDLGPDCEQIYVVLSGDHGTTVTLSHDTTPVRKYLQLTRSRSDKRFAFVIADKVSLQEAESKIIFLPKGSRCSVGARGGNIFFVKNGGTAFTGSKGVPSSVAFHEPHARVPGPAESTMRIPTPAIRESYVEQLLTIKK